MIKTKILTGCACGFSLLLTNSCSDKALKPNVLFILADDLRADALGCYGNNFIKTPNTDRLAETGILFKKQLYNGRPSWSNFCPEPGNALKRKVPVQCLR